ncbi:hypothetical protein ACFP81_05300 [Deinococcus lacus]|uniref:Uncharacterized protein n=1 Tax=Deinococcus lacus TaxID=392561 RepID=A0ABW1YBV3_9DEIO
MQARREQRPSLEIALQQGRSPSGPHAFARLHAMWEVPSQSLTAPSQVQGGADTPAFCAEDDTELRRELDRWAAPLEAQAEAAYRARYSS